LRAEENYSRGSSISLFLNASVSPWFTSEMSAGAQGLQGAELKNPLRLIHLRDFALNRAESKGIVQNRGKSYQGRKHRHLRLGVLEVIFATIANQRLARSEAVKPSEKVKPGHVESWKRGIVESGRGGSPGWINFFEQFHPQIRVNPTKSR
jgi:hypothetical protein